MKIEIRDTLEEEADALSDMLGELCTLGDAVDSWTLKKISS